MKRINLELKREKQYNLQNKLVLSRISDTITLDLSWKWITADFFVISENLIF